MTGRFDLDTREGLDAMREHERQQTQVKRRRQLLRNRESSKLKREYQGAQRRATRKIREEQARRNEVAKQQMAKAGGCGPNSFRCPAARNMKLDTPECCKRWIRQILSDVAGLLDELGVVWWVDYGTLLGQIRHGGLIPWDKDADLGMMADGRDKLLAAFPTLVGMGYFPTYVQPRPQARFRTGDRVKVRLSQRNHTNTDIFIWNRRPGGMLDRTNYIGADLYKGREFPEAWVEPIQRVPFDGFEVATVAEAEKLVEHRYGPDWRTPEHSKHPAEVRE